jgi:DNA polymerase-1
VCVCSALVDLLNSDLQKIIFAAKDVIADIFRFFGRRRVGTRPDAASDFNFSTNGNLFEEASSQSLRDQKIYFPRIISPDVAAWMLDPDDRHESEFQFAALRNLYLPTQSETGPTDLLLRSEATTFLMDFKQVSELWAVVQRLLAQQGMLDAFHKQEMLVTQVLAEMQVAGVSFDDQLFRMRRSEIEKELLILEASAHRAAGRSFMLTSSDQVSSLLFDELKLPKVKVSGKHRVMKKDRHSTGEPVLRQLITLHPLPGLILKHRGLSKILTTYMDPMIQAAVSISGAQKRIFTTWNQTMTGTGRLSAQKPNLQSLPKRKHATAALDDGEDQVLVIVRDAFCVSGADRILICADYNQMEMRLLAHAAGDSALIELFRSEKDVYYVMAAWVCQTVSPSPEERDMAKTICLGILYGMGAAQLAVKLGQLARAQVPLEKARTLLEAWHTLFPKVRPFIQETYKKARQLQYVTTIKRRRRPLPDILSLNHEKRAYAERQSVNTIIQGSGSDLVKTAMIQLRASELFYRPARPCEIFLDGEAPLAGSCDIVLQFHDEIVLEVPCSRNAVQKAVSVIRRCMEECLPESPVPFPVQGWRSHNFSSLIVIFLF